MKLYEVENASGERAEATEEGLGKAFAEGFDVVVKHPETGEEATATPVGMVKAVSAGFQPVYTTDTSMLESGARGVAQGVSFGFADEITGGAEALYDIATTDKSLSDYDDIYEQRRNESREAYKEAEAANPGTYLAGEVGGAIGSSFIPGVGAIGNVARGAKLGTVAAKAALGGGIDALGRSEADLGSAEMASDVAIGAGLGSVGGAIVAGAGKIIPSLRKATQYHSNNVKNLAEREAFNATGSRIADLKKVMRESGGSPEHAIQRQQEIGRTLLDQKVNQPAYDAALRLDPTDEVSKLAKKEALKTADKSLLNPFDSAEDLAIKLSNSKNLVGKEIGEIQKELDKLQPLSTPGHDVDLRIQTKDVAVKLKETLELTDVNEVGYDAARKSLQKEVDSLINNETVSFVDLFNKRKYIDRQISWSVAEDKPKNELYKAYRKSINDTIDEKLNSLTTGFTPSELSTSDVKKLIDRDSLVQRLRTNQKQYHNLMSIQGAVNNQAVREQASTGFNPLDFKNSMTGIAGGMSGGVLGAVGAIAGREVIDQVNTPINRSKFYDYMSKKATRAANFKVTPSGVPAIGRSIGLTISQLLNKPEDKFSLQEKQGYIKAAKYQRENPGDEKGLEKYLRVIFPTIRLQEATDAWLKKK